MPVLRHHVSELPLSLACLPIWVKPTIIGEEISKYSKNELCSRMAVRKALLIASKTTLLNSNVLKRGHVARTKTLWMKSVGVNQSLQIVTKTLFFLKKQLHNEYSDTLHTTNCRMYVVKYIWTINSKSTRWGNVSLEAKATRSAWCEI